MQILFCCAHTFLGYQLLLVLRLVESHPSHRDIADWQ
jgi:hypothetical protein